MNQTVIIVIVIILAFLSYGYLSSITYKNKLMKLNASRPNLTKEEYIKLLVEKGFDQQHIEVVYDEIKECVAMDNFSLYPEDDIHKVYEIGDLDDIELMERIRNKLNLRKAEDSDHDELEKQFEVFNAEYILSLTKKLAK